MQSVWLLCNSYCFVVCAFAAENEGTLVIVCSKLPFSHVHCLTLHCTCVSLCISLLPRISGLPSCSSLSRPPPPAPLPWTGCLCHRHLPLPDPGRPLLQRGHSGGCWGGTALPLHTTRCECAVRALPVPSYPLLVCCLPYACALLF